MKSQRRLKQALRLLLPALLIALAAAAWRAAQPSQAQLSFGPGAPDNSLAASAASVPAAETGFLVNAAAQAGPASPGAACSGGPTIDGVLLDECYDENFVVGGVSKTIRVWYTKNMTAASRTVDGVTYNLQHWINSDAEAQRVGRFGREAWQKYYAIFARGPYDTGCGNRINVQLEDGIGWAGIAYWASSGVCNIGIDSPTVRAGNEQWAVYHEFQHYLQYAYDSGCYAFLQANYSADAEFVEGYADLGADAVDATMDIAGYNNIGYDPTVSMFDTSYGNLYNKYFIEQLGGLYSASQPEHHMDALRHHYEACDVADTLYVLDTLIPSLKPGKTEESFFTDFFAANYLKKWADPATQPELVYTDDDSSPYADIALRQNVNLSSGTPQSWSEATPDDWAGYYYQVRPQAGCDFVEVKVDGASGAYLGINLMAVDSAAPTSVRRYAWLGENFSRIFPGVGTFDRIAASINAFDAPGSYTVSFTCVAPTLQLLEPRQANYALVGAPDSPIAFLARFKLTSGGAPVTGLLEADVTADAGGDAPSIVPGSFQQVGEEYWAVMLPPVKPAGTTFVDLKVCASGTVCDTETNALLYVAPGNTDFALVFDGSGSMTTEDLVGQGTRLFNAQRAGTVMADLLRVGDRIVITDFSAHDNPPGCGMPSGDGNCALDIITRLPRTDVTDPASTVIAAAHTAINNLTAREWTPIGPALVDAKDQLLAGPANTNPKHIVLLSDGDENVKPLYNDVRAELIDSGVVIDTVRFSNDAPGALLAQIAADTGGIYRYVPTTTGSQRANADIVQANRAQLSALGASDQFINSMAATLLPGSLGLNDVYDYIETKSQDASRLFHEVYLATSDGTSKKSEIYVDGSVNTLRIVVSGKQGDYCSDGFTRYVDIYPPDLPLEQRGYPISPANKITPADWDIRNSTYDDVLIVTNPKQGLWNVRTQYYACGPAAVESVQLYESDFMVNASAETNIMLQGRFLAPIVNNQGVAGDIVPIVAVLLNKGGTIPGAKVEALIEKPGGSSYYLLLLDDGAHADGAANDGIYGGEFPQTTLGGTYNVSILAFWKDDTGNFLTRLWHGGFWIKGPEFNDNDQDGMPDDWEKRCELDLKSNDARLDKDDDGLTNISEFQYGTLPCKRDTDRGGENDGSEVRNQRNPLYAKDDKVSRLRHFSIAGLNELILIRWTPPFSYTNMRLYLSTDPLNPGKPIDLGDKGEFLLDDQTLPIANGETYYAWLEPEYVDPTGGGQATGEMSEPVTVTPKLDPDPPSGAMLINQGDAQTNSRDVTLFISSTDTPLEGAAESANAHMGGPLAIQYNEVSGGVEMRISNDPDMTGASWTPLAAEQPWQLPDNGDGTYRVYIQFRDAALNESLIISDEIEFVTPPPPPALQVFLPLVVR